MLRMRICSCSKRCVTSQKNTLKLRPQVIVELATLAGAAALGQQPRVGSLAAGKQADLVAIALPPSGAGGPHAFLADPTCRIEHVYQTGKLVFSFRLVCRCVNAPPTSSVKFVSWATQTHELARVVKQIESYSTTFPTRPPRACSCGEAD